MRAEEQEGREADSEEDAPGGRRVGDHGESDTDGGAAVVVPAAAAKVVGSHLGVVGAVGLPVHRPQQPMSRPSPPLPCSFGLRSLGVKTNIGCPKSIHEWWVC